MNPITPENPKPTYNFKKLKEITKIVTTNLNKIIDINYYPIPEVRTNTFDTGDRFSGKRFHKDCRFQAKLSNSKNRPIGIGIQGLADLFIMMRYPFESEEAQLLNRQIFETLYHGALEASCELAQKYGPYETYPGSPVSKGVRRVN